MKLSSETLNWRRLLKTVYLFKIDEEFKESIFRKLPSLLYIMIYAYNDYIFLENLLYNHIELKEFSIGKSVFGSKVLSTIFLSNIKYLLRYMDSKKFKKIIRLTFLSLSVLGSENDFYLSNLFKIDKYDLIDFVNHYDLGTVVNYNNNFPFFSRKDGDSSSEVKFEKKFVFPAVNRDLFDFMEFLSAEKIEVETLYTDYFTFRIKNIAEVLKLVLQRIEKFFEQVKKCNPVEAREREEIGDMASLLKQAEAKKVNIKLDQFRGDFSVTDIQLAMNKTHYHHSILKVLKICHTYNGVSEGIFGIILSFIEFYVKDNIANHIAILQACYLRFFQLHFNNFNYLILEFIYKCLKFLHKKKVYLCDYSTVFELLKECFNSKFAKLV